MVFKWAILGFTISLLIVSLYLELFHPAVSFFLAISLLVLTGILAPSEALKGFSNETILALALLLGISLAIKKSTLLKIGFSRLTERARTLKDFLLRMMLISSITSAFLNNTAVVTTLLPLAYQWANKYKKPISKLLIPLSFSAILGGTMTLIGTSTNLVLNALLVERGLKPLSIFSFTPVGIALVIVGTLYLLFIGERLLPDRFPPIESFRKERREYLIELRVESDSPLLNKKVGEIPLRNLRGLYLVEIIRGSRVIAPVSPDEVIQDDDRLIFVGDTSTISDLLNTEFKLSLVGKDDEDFLRALEEYELVEAVVTPNSPLVNKKVRESNFRARYDAAILAVHRNGEPLRGKIGEVRLKAGDLLLIITGSDFWKRLEDITDLYIVERVTNLYNWDILKDLVVLLSFVLVIILSAFKVIPFVIGLFLLVSFYAIIRVLKYSEIRRDLDLGVIVIAALSIGLGEAMLKTGLAEKIAEQIVAYAQPLGLLPLMASIYLITSSLAQVINNVAAVSIMLPVSLKVASIGGYPLKPFALLTAYASAGSFLTPVAYQTNLIVYSLGGYKFKDFLKIGFPLLLIYMLTCLLAIYLIYF